MSPKIWSLLDACLRLFGRDDLEKVGNDRIFVFSHWHLDCSITGIGVYAWESTRSF